MVLLQSHYGTLHIDECGVQVVFHFSWFSRTADWWRRNGSTLLSCYDRRMKAETKPMHHYMKRLSSLVFLLLSIICHAQTPKGLKYFNVIYPQSTITQGEWIRVQYTLDAEEFSSWKVDEEPGILMETCTSSITTLIDGTQRLWISCNFSVNTIGQATIPSIVATVKGQSVRTNTIYIYAEPSPKYGKEWKYARDFLIARGVTPSNLAARYSGETLVAFSDNQQKVFAIVCTSAYERYIDNPVLAYGIGNSMWDGESGNGENSIYHIINRYDAQLRLLKEKGQYYSPLSNPLSNPFYKLYKDHPEGIKPMLGDIKYGQRRPYNNYFPKEYYNGKDSTCLVGCGPVALVEVLSYHKSAVLPTGKGVLKTGSGKQYEIMMKDNPYSWNGSDSSLASLMLCAAASVNAEVAPDGSASSLINFKPALINNWNYSPQCTYVLKLKDETMLEMVYADLNAGRPVIASDAAHIMVIDGYFEDYLHLDLGWNGYCNGYYRAIILPFDSRRQLPFNELLTGIRPRMNSENLSLTIESKKPGKLEETIAKVMKKKSNRGRQIVSLKITGKINGNDIAVLRKLAGAVPYGRYEEGHGSLMDLDLSEAQILKGGCYVTQSANKMIFYGATPQGLPYRYDMSNLGSHQWAEMQALQLTNSDSMIIQPDGAGGYSVSRFATADTIGPYMFSDCQNLRHLALPKSAKAVMENAFFGSRTLLSVDNLPAVVATDAFENSRLNNQ